VAPPDGTACYSSPAWPRGADTSAWLNVVGSLGFSGVDVLELRALRGDARLSLSSLLSCVGSALHVIGSHGGVPAAVVCRADRRRAGFLWRAALLLAAVDAGAGRARRARRAAAPQGSPASAPTRPTPSASSSRRAWARGAFLSARAALLCIWPPAGEAVADALLWAIVLVPISGGRE